MKAMQTFYCVTSSVDDKGHMTAAITAEYMGDECPENSRISTRHRDIYKDWFDSFPAAEAFVKEARSA